MRLPRFWTLFLTVWALAVAAFPPAAPAQPPPPRPLPVRPAMTPPTAAPFPDGSISLTGGLASGSDITAAALAAITRAEATQAPLCLPAGTYSVSQTLTLHEDLRGTGFRSVLIARGLPPGAALLTVQAPNDCNAEPVVSGLRLIGPGIRQLGVRTAHCDGLRAEGPCRLIDLRVTNFDAGVVAASFAGHLYLTGCKLTDDFYGLYNTLATGDLRVTDCELDGDTMAAVGMSATGGIHSSSFIGTPLGFGPYGIYQEPGSVPGPFLSDVLFSDCAFEACGNAAIWSDDACPPGGARCEFANVKILNRTGFSWDGSYRILSRPAREAVHGDLCFRRNIVEDGNYPFTAGPDGGPVWDFAQYVSGSVVLDGTALSTLP